MEIKEHDSSSHEGERVTEIKEWEDLRGKIDTSKVLKFVKDLIELDL